MMTEAKLKKAISEAERFIRCAKAAKNRLEWDKFAGISGSKETGAARRASLDLTRILADLRKP